MEEHNHCDCHHEHCKKLVKPQKATNYPLTMENLEKSVKNINAIIDLNDTRQDENREQMIIFIKIFCDDLTSKFKGKINDDKNKPPETKEPEIPIIEKINKTLINLLQLKSTVIQKYGGELLDKFGNYMMKLMNTFLQKIFYHNRKIKD